MRVLSLFDGMACGMIAFKVAGIPIDSYDAYEIDKFAVQVATHNFPDIKEHGDVFKADFAKYEGIDYVVGGSPCFTAGHLILTDKGYVDVKDIKTGDMVLTHKGRYKPVIRTNERVSKVCEVNAMGYPTFTTTAEHPFYTLGRRKATYAEYKQLGSWRTFDKEPKWTAAKDLTNNHFVGMHIDKTEGAQSIDCETAYILGRYVADGHLRKTKRTGRKNSYQYQVVLSIGAEKVKQFKERVKYHHFSCYLHTDNVYRCVFSNQELLEFIRSNGFGEGAANKNIPKMIHGQMPKVKEAFLMGYIEGDGCYIAKEDKYLMSTVSPRLAFGLQRLITSLWQTNVSVSVSNNNKPHKIGNREIKANYPLYTICAKREIRKQTVAHIQDGIMWTQIKSVTPTEREKTVYNIEVADDNSYTVNNCIVHNCTYWSIAQSPDKRETTASGIGWELFSQYVRAIKEAKPKYFIYENNKSMAKAIYDSISATFGFEPIMINSALVSAQNRERYYWVGKRNEYGEYDKVMIEQPGERGITMSDIIESGKSPRKKGYAITHLQGNGRDYFKKHHTNIAFEPVQVGVLPRKDGSISTSKPYRIYSTNGKGVTIQGQAGGLGAKTGLYAIKGKTFTISAKHIVIGGKPYEINLPDGEYTIRPLTVSETKKMQTVPEWYEFPCSDTAAQKMLGNGWTIEVIVHLIRATQEGKTEAKQLTFWEV